MRHIWVIALAAMLCAGEATYGAMLSAGTRQLTVSGRLDRTEKLNFSLTGNAGYFLRDRLEVGVLGGLEMLHGNDVTTFATGGFSEYNFLLRDNESIVPFIGGSLSLKYASYNIAGNVDPNLPGDVDKSDFVIELGGYAGARYFITENFAIGSAVRIFVATGDIYLGDNAEFESLDMDVILDTSFYF